MTAAPAAAEHGHRRLTPEVVARARDLAGDGLPLASIAAGCGVGYSSLRWWLKRARDGEGSELELALLSAMQEGAADGERQLLARIRAGAAAEWKAAAWLLSHSPRWRDSWSERAGVDAALSRQARQVLDALMAPDFLPPDQQRELLLRLKAAGLFGEDQPEP